MIKFRARWFSIGVVLAVAALACVSEVWSQRPPGLEDVNTLWPALSPPASHDELMTWAARLEMTREQMIAAERLHAAYLEDAFLLRQRSIDGLCALDPNWMLVAQAPPVESHWRKMLAIRRSYLRDLSQRDDLLLTQIGELLTDSQRAAIPRLQLRRARGRLLADGFIAPWLHEAPLLELADLIEGLELSPDQASAADAIIEDCERKAVRALETLEARLNDMRLAWLKIEWRDNHDGRQLPDHETFEATMISLAEPARAVLDSEYEAMDRLKAVLPSDVWRKLGLRQAVAAGSWGPDSAGGLVSIDAALKRPDLSDEQRQSLEALRIELAPRYDEAAFESARGFRRYRWTNPVNLGPINLGRYLTNDEQQAVMNEFRASGAAYSKVSQDARDRLQAILGADAYKSLRDEVSRARESARDREAIDAAALGGNIVDWSWNLRPWELISDAPSIELVERVADAIGVNPDQRDALRTSHRELASAVRVANMRVETAIREASRMQSQPDWPERGRAIAITVAEVVAETEKHDAAFMHAVEQALAGSPAADRSWIVALARTWEVISHGPRNLPPPMEFTNSSRQLNLVSLLDRVNPVSVLASMDLDGTVREAAMQTLRERTPSIAAKARSVRLIAAQAFTNAILVQAEGRKMSNQRSREDWKYYEDVQKAANVTAVDALKARRETTAMVREALQAVEQSLPDESARLAFHQSVGRVAYPIAWREVQAAADMFKRAEQVIDLTALQRNAVHEAAMAHGASMREAAMRIERLLDDFEQADAPQHDARCVAAIKWARLEQAVRQLYEQRAASIALLRPILNPAQMQIITSLASGR